MAAGIVALREKMELHNNYVKKLKEMEANLTGQILNNMSAQGVKTMTFDGIGRVETSSKDHAEIRDFPKMCNFMLREAAKALKAGAPVDDAMSLLQRTVKLKTVQTLLEAGFTQEELGVEIVEKPVVKFVKAK